MRVQWNPTSTEARMLQIDQVPGYLFRERAVSLDRVRNYVSTVEGSGLKPLPVTRQQQLDDVAAMVEDPVHDPYVACISSEPNDLAAKVIAAGIMLAARRERHRARWHTLIGGYRDELRDRPYHFMRNDLFVFSNITHESTDQKIEKLRDLLELFSDRPRIVTLTGAEPVAFFNSIGYPLNYSVWIRSTRTTRVLGN